MERVEIIAKGEVQRAGYRDYVERVARNLGVLGYVENLEDGNVRIIGESDRETLERFIDELYAKDDPLIKVTDLEIRYGKATNEFKNFIIKRGSVDEETGERLDTAAFYLKGLINATMNMNENLGGKIDQMLEKQDETTNAINRLDSNVIQRFDGWTLNMEG